MTPLLPFQQLSIGPTCSDGLGRLFKERRKFLLPRHFRANGHFSPSFALLLSRKVLESSQKIAQWKKEHPLDLETKTFAYSKGISIPVYNFQTDKPETYSSPRTFRIIYGKDALKCDRIKEISILILDRRSEQGAYKTIYPTTTYIVRRDVERPVFFSSLRCFISPQSFIVAIPNKMKEGNSWEWVVRGINHHREILQRVPEQKRLFFTALPMVCSTLSAAHELIQHWYPGNFFEAARRRQLPIDSRASHYEPVELRDLLSVLCDVCEGLKAMHETHIIHRDCKATNILLEFTKEINERGSHWRGRLNDFDLTVENGRYYLDQSHDAHIYYCWSRSAQHGFVIPATTDGFGLIQVLGSIFFLKSLDWNLLPKGRERIRYHPRKYLRLLQVSLERLRKRREGDPQYSAKAKVLDEVHSFIRECVIKDSEMSDIALKTLAKGDSAEICFNKIKQSLLEQKYSDIFSIENLQKKVMEMLESLSIA